MAGSLKWMKYTADNGQTYAVRIDESNGEAGGFADVVPEDTGLTQLPKGIKMRHVNTYQASASDRKRRFYIGGGEVLTDILAGTQTIISAPVVGTETAENFVITSYRGEQSSIIGYIDTGLNDGDAT